jgi:hypothetical protein
MPFDRFVSLYATCCASSTVALLNLTDILETMPLVLLQRFIALQVFITSAAEWSRFILSGWQPDAAVSVREGHTVEPCSTRSTGRLEVRI